MKIGILETGHLSETLQQKYGHYPLMFSEMLAPYMPDTTFETFHVIDGQLPGAVDDADGWIVTGSRHGAYERLDWMNRLEGFLRECLSTGAPVVGICFGHQILAQAMGGKVVNSDKGWGFGAKEYAITAQPDWLSPLGAGFASHAVHQDQVVEAPENTTVFATSDFCPIAGLSYGDQERPKAISIQPHPEMSAQFVSDLADERLVNVIPPEQFEPGYKSLGTPVDNKTWAKTIAAFFRTSRMPES